MEDRKRHIVVDSMGLQMALLVTASGVHHVTPAQQLFEWVEKSTDEQSQKTERSIGIE